MSLKKEIFSMCNSSKKKTRKRLLSIYRDEFTNKKENLVLPKNKICHDLVQKELANYHSTIDDRLFFIVQLIHGVIQISKRKYLTLSNLNGTKSSKVNMLSNDNKPIDILNFFERSPKHECLFLQDSLGKMSYPFCLSFKDNNLKLSLKIGYFIRKSIRNYPQKKSLVLRKDKIKLKIKKQHNLSSDNPSISQLYSQFMVSENMSQIEKKVINYRQKKFLPYKKYNNLSLLNEYVELDPDLPVNVENRIIYLLSEFVFKKYTPHINLPIFFF